MTHADAIASDDLILVASADAAKLVVMSGAAQYRTLPIAALSSLAI